MPNNEKKFQATLLTVTDQASLARAKQALAELEQANKGVKKTAEEASKGYQQMMEGAEKLQRISSLAGAASAAILTPLTLAAKAYLDQANKLKEAQASGQVLSKQQEQMVAGAERWNAATARAQEAIARIGGVVIEQVTPGMEAIADILDKVAKFAEDNPWVVKAALAVGGTLAGIATIGTIVAQVTAAVGALGSLSTMLGGGAAAGGAGALGLGAGAVALGPLAAAVAALVALLSSKFGQSGVAAGGQLLTVGAYKLGGLFGPEVAAQWGQAMGKLTGAIQEAKPATANAASGVETWNAAMAKAYVTAQQADKEAETQYKQKRSQMSSDFYRQEAESYQDFTRSQAKAAADYARSEKQAEVSYYSERTKAASQYNTETVKAEREHQKNIQRMREDFEDKLADLADARDALGIMRAQRDFEKQRSQADQDFSEQQAQRRSDYAMQAQELAANFASQRAQRQADFAAQQAERQQEFNIQRQRARDNLTRQLQELDNNYQQEKAKRREALAIQLADLQDATNQERRIKAQMNQAMINDMMTLAKQAQTQMVAQSGVATANNPSGNRATAGYPGVPGRSYDLGGYTVGGVAELHPGEFVMRDDVTRAAEQLAGRQLDNGSLLRMFQGAASKKIEYHDNKRFSGDYGAGMRRAVRNDFNDWFSSAFAEG